MCFNMFQRGFICFNQFLILVFISVQTFSGSRARQCKASRSCWIFWFMVFTHSGSKMLLQVIEHIGWSELFHLMAKRDTDTGRAGTPTPDTDGLWDDLECHGCLETSGISFWCFVFAELLAFWKRFHTWHLPRWLYSWNMLTVQSAAKNQHRDTTLQPVRLAGNWRDQIDPQSSDSPGNPKGQKRWLSARRLTGSRANRQMCTWMPRWGRQWVKQLLPRPSNLLCRPCAEVIFFLTDQIVTWREDKTCWEDIYI